MKTSISIALGRFATRLHERAGDGHHVVSPLGAWLLLAICSGLADDEAVIAELEEVIGVSIDEASGLAAELLSAPHPAVSAAAAAWVHATGETPRFKEWLGRLPPTVDTGDIPSRQALDSWADRNTKGLIKRFPLWLPSDVVCLLATAVAGRVSWEVPFEVVDANHLGPTPWAQEVERVLRAPDDTRHVRFLARTQKAGDVAVHLARSHEALLVGSVIAAEPTTPASAVLAAAHDIATAEALGTEAVQRLSLFDLPIGEGALWSLTEERVPSYRPGDRDERVVSILPAWNAETSLDLGGRDLGFSAAASAVAEALELRDKWNYTAAQSTMARYHATGFEAGAIMGLMAAGLASRPSHVVTLRTAVVRYGHPYAVVAVADASSPWATVEISEPWQGIPVFSAWVTEPAEPELVDEAPNVVAPG